jgi:hypothetical protein
MRAVSGVGGNEKGTIDTRQVLRKDRSRTTHQDAELGEKINIWFDRLIGAIGLLHAAVCYAGVRSANDKSTKLNGRGLPPPCPSPNFTTIQLHTILI